MVCFTDKGIIEVLYSFSKLLRILINCLHDKGDHKDCCFGLVKGIIKMIGFGSPCLFLTKCSCFKCSNCQFVFCLLGSAMFYEFCFL